jgi:hypothetical protein
MASRAGAIVLFLLRKGMFFCLKKKYNTPKTGGTDAAEMKIHLLML